MEMDQTQERLFSVESKNGLYVAHFIQGRMEGWGMGAINAENPLDLDSEETLAQQVVDSIKPVTEEEQSYSDCTDGRFREKLEDGGEVPNREKLVGTDFLTSFYIAEALGSRIYENPRASTEERVTDVAERLKKNGFLPSAHFACGAMSAFVPVSQNAINFAQNPLYVERQRSLLPVGVYDEELHSQMLRDASQRLEMGRLKDYDPHKVLEIVSAVSGNHAIISVRNDGTGVDGHNERMIVRQVPSGAAVDINALAEASGGGQVLSINDARLWKLARIFGRGEDTDYRIACMAAEDFTDAAHGTLARNMPTLVVAQAA